MGTTPNLSLTYSDTRGDGVEWADDYEGNLSILDTAVAAKVNTADIEELVYALQGKKKNVLTSVWEVPVAGGTEYYDGLVFGVQAYYKRFAGNFGSASPVLESNTLIDKFANPAEGWAYDETAGQRIAVNTYLSTSIWTCLELDGGAGPGTWDLILSSGAGMSSATDAYDIGVSYFK